MADAFIWNLLPCQKIRIGVEEGFAVLILSKFDSQVLKLLNSYPLLDPLMLFIDANFGFLLFLLLASLFYFKGRKDAALYLTMLITVWALIMFLKPVFMVARPKDIRSVLDVAGYSMPSGHAAMSFASAVFLHSRAGRYRLLLWIGAGMVSISRVFLGVHAPSDVLAGAFLGGLVGYLWYWIDKLLLHSEIARKYLDTWR